MKHSRIIAATVLIGTRALMGIGASAIMPATLSVLTNVFHDPRERARAIGMSPSIFNFAHESGQKRINHFIFFDHSAKP